MTTPEKYLDRRRYFKRDLEKVALTARIKIFKQRDALKTSTEDEPPL